MLSFDHVVVAVGDLDEAARWLFAKHGLASVIGGRHEGQGTGNRIIPLGDSYIELMGVVDATEAHESALGRWLAGRLVAGDGRLGPLALRTDDVDSVAKRIASEPQPLSRERPDGVVLSWRLVGLEQALADPSLPFFLAFDGAAEAHPGKDAAPHRVSPAGISWVELAGDPERISGWLGGHTLDVRVATGEPGVRAVGIATDAGEIVLD